MAKVQQMPAASVGSGSMAEQEVEQFPAGLRVLVVDDDVTCLAILRQMLLKCRYEVTTCSQATKALSLLRESKGGFHVVISDVHMPDMDGFRLLELVGLEMDLPVIMMSADARTNVVMQGIKHGACDYLIKPVRMEELKNIWQHVVRKKRRDNELELSGSLDDTDRSKQVAEDVEYASSVNDGADAAWKSQKRRRNIKEEDDSELESGDPSSKKPRVVWSVELHQQFVNAVNQLGIDQAVPKRILELMNVPGLTRENVASHLQKFRLYLKRLSGVSLQHSGLPSSFCAPVSSVKANGPLGGLDFRALAASGQIPPQTLAALQDELLDQPSGSLFLPPLNQPSRRASNEGTKRAPIQREIAFGQPLFTFQPNISRQFPPSTRTVPDVPFAFSSWMGNNDIAVSSGKFGGLGNAGNSSVLAQMLQQQRKLNSPLSESPSSLNVQPSCVVIPSESLNTLQGGETPMRNNQTPFLPSAQSSTSLEAANLPSSKNPDVLIVPSESSTSLNTPNNSGPVIQNSTIFPSESLAKLQGGASMNHKAKPALSQPLANIKTEFYPFHANENFILVSPEPSSSLQEGSGPTTRSDNLNYNSSSATLDYSLPSSQSKNVRFGVGQIVDEGFRNSSISTCYSVPGFISSLASSCTDGSTVWQGQSARGNNNTANASSSFLPNFSEIQNSTSLPGNLSQGRNLGFVGKGTCIPSRFAVDDVESPTNSLDQSNISISDCGDMINPENFGFNGLL